MVGIGWALGGHWVGRAPGKQLWLGVTDSFGYSDAGCPRMLCSVDLLFNASFPADVLKFLRMLTFLPLEEVAAMEAAMQVRLVGCGSA